MELRLCPSFLGIDTDGIFTDGVLLGQWILWYITSIPQQMGETIFSIPMPAHLLLLALLYEQEDKMDLASHSVDARNNKGD